jgi:hypothetical protein
METERTLLRFYLIFVTIIMAGYLFLAITERPLFTQLLRDGVGVLILYTVGLGLRFRSQHKRATTALLIMTTLVSIIVILILLFA